VQVAGVAWRVTMMIVVRVGDLMRKTRDGQAQVGYSVIGRSGGRVTLCAVCTVHEEMMSACFLVQLQNQGRRFVSDLTSKPLGRFISGLASKPLGRFSPVWTQNRW
jgi:hypothetical protein